MGRSKPAAGAALGGSMVASVGVEGRVLNEDLFNEELRKFLKAGGMPSPREIEEAVRQALAEDRIRGNETLTARMVLTIDKAGLSYRRGCDPARLSGPAGTPRRPGRERLSILL